MLGINAVSGCMSDGINGISAGMRPGNKVNGAVDGQFRLVILIVPQGSCHFPNFYRNQEKIGPLWGIVPFLKGHHFYHGLNGKFFDQALNHFIKAENLGLDMKIKKSTHVASENKHQTMSGTENQKELLKDKITPTPKTKTPKYLTVFLIKVSLMLIPDHLVIQAELAFPTFSE